MFKIIENHSETEFLAILEKTNDKIKFWINIYEGDIYIGTYPEDIQYVSIPETDC